MPNPEQLRRLMPAAPARARSGVPLLSPGLAAAAIMVLALFSAITLFASQRPGAWSLSAPTAYATAVTLTDTPTQTATQEVTVTAEGLEAYSSPAPVFQAATAGQAVVPAPALVPVPAAPMLQ